MKFLSFVGVAALTCSIAFGADEPPKAQEGTSSVKFTTDKDGNKNIVIHNHSYLFADTIYLESGKDVKPTAFLITQDLSSSVQMLPDTPPTAKLKSQAWTGTGDFPRKLLWTIETDGNSAAIEDRLYAVTRDGFEDDFTTYTYFRMADGKKIFTSNTPLLTVYTNDDIGIPRHIGFQDQFGDKELPKALVDKKIAGFVTYGDDHGVTKTIGIFGWPTDDKPSPPSAYLKYNQTRVEDHELYLRENKETGTAALSHFSVVIVLSDGIEVEIPVENDVPQLDKARLPKGYTLELMP